VHNWVLKKPMAEHREGIEACIDRSVRALPSLVAGDFTQAMMQIHTSKPPRPKPPRKELDEAPPAPQA
jgi:PTH1 family peptidyl-tRNA hydrolase